jgi:hypothetical protein
MVNKIIECFLRENKIAVLFKKIQEKLVLQTNVNLF